MDFVLTLCYNEYILLEGGRMLEEKEWFCNYCGRKLRLDRSPREDVFVGRKEWGYFSQKDIQVHEFLLCEKCYDEIISHFAVPVKISAKTEVLQEEGTGTLR